MTNTTTPLSDTAVANMAANTLDDRALASLDDTSTSFGKFVNREFGYLRDEFLAQYPYAFAEEYATLPELANKPPFGWSAAYNLPSSCLRLLPLTEDGLPHSRPLKYKRVGRRIFVNKKGSLNIRFIQRVTNIAVWDPLPARALGQYIALQAAHRITGKISYVDKARLALREASWMAQHVDSLERGTPEDVEEADIVLNRSLEYPAY